jgi:DNA-binding XRE family transcriptional regulator
VICPDCKGRGEVFAFINRGEDYRKHTQEYIRCDTCNGWGRILFTKWVRLRHWRRLGRKVRDIRISYYFTFSKASELLGIKPHELSAIEHGRVNPKKYIKRLKKALR